MVAFLMHFESKHEFCHVVFVVPGDGMTDWVTVQGASFRVGFHKFKKHLLARQLGQGILLLAICLAFVVVPCSTTTFVWIKLLCNGTRVQISKLISTFSLQ